MKEVPIHAGLGVKPQCSGMFWSFPGQQNDHVFGKVDTVLMGVGDTE